MGGHSSATPLIWSPGSCLCVPSSTHTTHSQLLSTVHRSWHSCALRTLAERNRLCVLWFERLNEPIEQTKTWTSGWVSEGIWNEMMECNLLDQHLAKNDAWANACTQGTTVAVIPPNGENILQFWCMMLHAEMATISHILTQSKTTTATTHNLHYANWGI